MERLRKSFRRKKPKQFEEDRVDDEVLERDVLEQKTVYDEEKSGETDSSGEEKLENNNEATNTFSMGSRLHRLRKSLMIKKRKKGSATEENDVIKDTEECVENKPNTRMSKLRSSFRIKKDRKGKKGSKKKEKKSSKWQIDDEKVRTNHCEFKVKYLGSLEVQESRGMDVCESAIKVLKKNSTNPVGKRIEATLHVSGDGLRVVDKKTKGMLVDQVIEKVSFCAPDRNISKGFAYISRDGTSRRWVCHGFLARRDSGERLSHAVGVAFAVCLERKKARTSEGVTGTWDEDNATFTRFGSFRQGTLTERLADPQEFKVTPLKVDLGLTKEDNPFAISRPRPGEVGARSSLRGLPAPSSLGVIRGQSPFKRGSESYSSLRPQV